MSVHINEIIIRAIITNDDKSGTAKSQPAVKKVSSDDDDKLKIIELVDEVIKNNKER